MDMQTVLAHYGVHEDTLSPAEKAFLDQNGYLPLFNLLSPEQVQAIATRLEALAAAEGDQAGLEAHQETGTTRLANLADKDPLFAVCFTHPRVLAAIARVLRQDFKLSSLNARFALPGEGLQHLHADWREGVAPGEFEVCNSIWLLDDFTAENGATRVVPGSHNSGKTPRDAMEDPKGHHPDETILTAPAGTVVIFNSHTWHGGTLNRTDKPRRAMHSYFTRRHNPQQTDQRKYVSPETLDRLSDEAKFILDVL
ncbi:MAG: phytanoyl-CoA dioxygenase family protein [Caldilineaceae bacterium]|nr:phytanoyl-CoA dioxygenase family protein [Caldilineaceae bacterium]